MAGPISVADVCYRAYKSITENHVERRVGLEDMAIERAVDKFLYGA